MRHGQQITDDVISCTQKRLSLSTLTIPNWNNNIKLILLSPTKTNPGRIQTNLATPISKSVVQARLRKLSSLYSHNDNNDIPEDHENQNTIQLSHVHKSETLTEDQSNDKPAPLDSNLEQAQANTTPQPHTLFHFRPAVSQDSNTTRSQPQLTAHDTDPTPDLNQLFMKNLESTLVPTSLLFSNSSTSDEDTENHIGNPPSQTKTEILPGRNNTPLPHQRGTEDGFQIFSAKKNSKRKQSNKSPSGVTPSLKMSHKNKSTLRK